MRRLVTGLGLIVALWPFLAESGAAATIGTIPTGVSAPSGQVSIDIITDIDTILYDLQASWDTSYWNLNNITGADGVVELDEAGGRADDIFGDVGTGDPIPAGTPLFTMIFDVVGAIDPARTVLEVGNLSAVDPSFFDRAVLVSDPDFNVMVPNADRSQNGLVLVPEPTTALLLAAGLAALSAHTRRKVATS